MDDFSYRLNFDLGKKNEIHHYTARADFQPGSVRHRWLLFYSVYMHGPGLKAIQANPGQQFSTRADTHNMLEYCPGHANPCLHEEISTIFTPSQPGSTRVSRRVPRVGEV